MELRVIREYYSPECTVGRLLIDGQFECYTLEDGIRTNKVYGETAIPTGLYPVKITFSNAFRRELPLVEGVKNFTGIRIHSGNTKKDTLGCILVGQTWSPGAEVIGSSVRALQALLPKIQAALAAGQPVRLSVEQPNAPPELASRDLLPVAEQRRRKASKATKRVRKRAGPAAGARQPASKRAKTVKAAAKKRVVKARPPTRPAKRSTAATTTAAKSKRPRTSAGAAGKSRSR
jgi:hypothetical protein